MNAASNLHAVAVACLARQPPLTPKELAFVSTLGAASDILWTPASPSDGLAKPPALDETGLMTDRIQLFLGAMNHLVPLAGASDAAYIAAVMRHLPQYWRSIPTAILGVMADRLATASETAVVLTHLEMRHIARWLVSASAPRKAGTDIRWEELIRKALAWEANDEIQLRQEPCMWQSPISAEAHVAGFDLVPVIESAQLVDSRHHKGVLCSLARRDACTAGREAWFFAESRVRSVGIQGRCLFGLLRADENAPWAVHEAYAPRRLLDQMHRCALSVQARHNSSVLRTKVRESVSGGLGLKAAIQTLQSMLQAFRRV